MPLIFLNNTTGFMVGTEYERAGMIKHGSKMIQAVSNVRVPRLSLYIGASFGAGNYAMCGYGYKPDFLFAWPNAFTGVMGGEQAAGTMDRLRARPPSDVAPHPTRPWRRRYGGGARPAIGRVLHVGPLPDQASSVHVIRGRILGFSLGDL
jgi:hypothetical protein